MATSSVSQAASWSSLKAKSLQRLALLCGLNVGGNKAEISARLARAAAAPPTSSDDEPVVLSIDLGIRNLAFSLMTPASASPFTRYYSRKKEVTIVSPSGQVLGPAARPPSITLHHWERLSLVDAQTSAVDSAAVEDEEPREEDVFSPAKMAKITNDFLQNTVLCMSPVPTHILIERQRWRTQSSASILEWTVRVNTLEAMLHASLQALRGVGVYEGEVTSVRPEAVAKLFLAADEEPPSPKVLKANIKKMKIETLTHWLGEGDDVIEPGTKLARQMIRAYKKRAPYNPQGRGRPPKYDKEEYGEELKVLDAKLDDLTDSLMQGMAWLRWQQNLAILREEFGAEELLKAASPSVPKSGKSKSS
ncbi:mitochondrial resolvase Ydc2 [Xylaria bambusicola]|uniref:mitochondrial resolvase Ydc2 n=1 Tax=Xylaria bambusicola TaxID=326684 RepID=UPI0020083698|nr:mitochondrial resolvase Ydc2 [Xylaria bambusicola]KAI0517255.1 mitochondrial resolvase Ydc2 [Xylaria bambusicola]